MNLIIRSSFTKDVFLDTGSQLIAFDGTPYARLSTVGGWEIVGEVNCLFDWQRDPGTYGPHYAVGTVVDRDGKGFVAGGSWVFINAWCDEHNASFHNAQIVSDRNEARRRAEQRGGVAW
jgi:hypothetical protein